MARTVVYSKAEGGDVDVDRADGIREKIAKYVPAEVISFFLAAVALAEDSSTLIVVALIIGLIATPGYLYIASRTLEVARQPRVYFYVLSTIAFMAWALATSGSIRELFGLDASTAQFILFVTVFILPLLDTAIGHLTKK